MRCEQVRNRLDDLLDGALPGDERARVEAHLAGCTECSGELEAIRRLLADISELPSEVETSRDLWPEIATRLEPRSTVVRGRFGAASRPWLAIAATVLAAIGSLVIAYSLGRQHSETRTVAVREATPLAVPASLAETDFAAAEVEFRAARDQLLAALASRSDSMSPETRRTVDANLRVIDEAIERISAALVDDPLNPRLANQLASAYRRQIELLQRANRLPAET
jgi:anti-sigma factor RsiW